ncbi:hypothetical protein FSP39_020903 [Pinctada imbricata]|uniref:Uncharacterized protein n=1 Tax=Pinctada imbricata TaxID=66713 RepID=A0AA88XXJ2_PINIB|nr:hypothetical protein FSP39_020903 [Pinctada imbricata]
MEPPFLVAVLATVVRISASQSSTQSGQYRNYNFTQNSTKNGHYGNYNFTSMEPPRACPVSDCPFECATIARVTTCRELFLNTGELNDQAIHKFIPEQDLRIKASGFYRQLQGAYVLDESKMSCDNVQNLLLSLAKANQDVVRNLVTMATGNITGNMDPVTILDSIPEIFFNYVKVDMIIQNVQTVCCNDEQFECMCRMSFRQNCLNSLKVQALACNASLLCEHPENVQCRRVKVNERAVEKYCLKSTKSIKPPEQWGSDEWNRILNSSFSSLLENKHLLRIVPKDLFLDSLQRRKCSSLHGAIKNMALHKVMEMLRGPNFRQLQSPSKQNVVSLVKECGGSYTALEKYVPDKTLLLDTVGTTVIKTPRQLLEMRKTLKQIKPTLAAYTKDDIVKYIRLFIDKKNQLQQLSDTALESALPEISHIDFNPSQLRKLYKRVSTMQRFSSMSTLVTDDVVALGNMLAVLPRQHLEEVPYSALGAAIAADRLKDLKWPKYMAKTVYSKFKQYLGKEANGDLLAVDLIQLGDLAVYLKPRDWRKISANEILGFLNATETVERVHRLFEHIGKAVENTLVNKLKTVPGSDEVLLHYEDFRKAAGRMSTNEISDVAAKLERGETVDVSLTKTQCKRTLAKMKQHLGPMDTWTTGNFETLKSSNLIGCISPRDLEAAINSNPNSLQIMSLVGGSQRTNEKMVSITYIALDRKNPSLTENQLEYFSTAQAQAISIDQFNSLNEAQKNVIEERAEMKYGITDTVKSVHKNPDTPTHPKTHGNSDAISSPTIRVARG